MEENTQQTGATGSDAATSAPAGGAQQSATDDLKKVADRAKAATGGFDFGKLFVGRLDQKNYIYAVIASIVLGSLFMAIPLIGFILSIGLLVIGVGNTVRRLHDIGQDGWIALVLLVPVIQLLFVLYLCWKHGDQGDNRFGGAPDPKRDFFKAVLNT